MTGRNALLSTELIKPIELMKSMDWAFPGHCKGQGSSPGQALFLFQPLRLFIYSYCECHVHFLTLIFQSIFY